jgi:nucleoside-diphosphate-sugar epimerase
MQKAQNNKQQILVVGANGFLGSALCRECLAKGYSVEGVIHTAHDKVSSGVKLLTLADLPRESGKYSTIYIVAGNFRSGYQDLTDANVIVPYKITEMYKEAKIIFISSTAVYGMHNDEINTTSSFNNPDTYGLSKLAGEYVVRAHKNSCVIRFSNLYGKDMDTKLLIPTMITAALYRKPVTIYGDGERVADYFYVNDAVRFCLSVALNRRSGIYLGVSGRSISNNTLADLIKRNIPGTTIRHTGIETAPSYRFHVPNKQNGLSFTPAYDYARGIKEMIENYE